MLPLRDLTPHELREINLRISLGQLRHLNGVAVTREIRQGLVTSDGQFAYEIEDDIIILLQHLALALRNEGPAEDDTRDGREEEETVRRFYEQFGWQKGKGELFQDTMLFEDLREVSHDYAHKCHLRVGRHLGAGGTCILDAASGPVQYPEYINYSDGFDYRICLDFSVVALREAKRKLGEKGIYLLADICNLPLEDCSVDAAISLHTIYHVAADKQSKAFREVYRVLKPGSSAVVVYTWGPHSPLMRLASPSNAINRAGINIAGLIARVVRRERRPATEEIPKAPVPNLYWYPHNYAWVTRELAPFLNMDILCWRSVSVDFQRAYIRDWLFGKQVLALVYWLEEKFPRLAGRLGQYPMIVMRKPDPREPS